MIVECPACKSRYDVGGRPAGTRARCRCGQVFTLPAAPPEAGMMACPNCGAAVAGDAHRCDYCAAELLVQTCPRCFANTFHGHTHCPRCGAELGLPARPLDAPPRACPVCLDRPPLAARLVGAIRIDQCGSCGGLWLDAATLERIVRERDASATMPLRELGGGPSVPPYEAAGAGARPAALAGAPPRRMYVPCPDCGTLMNRVNFAHRSGVILDVCRGHGAWFDADELPRIIDFVQKGGLDEARRREAEEAREQLRRARVERATAPLDALSAPVSNEHAGAADLVLSAIANLLLG